MQRWWCRLVVLCLCVGAGSSAQAQVHQGDVRLWLDASLVSWIQPRINADGRLGDYKERDVELGAGPSGSVLGTAGVGLGYAATRHLIPQLHFGLQNLRRTDHVEIGNRTAMDSEVTHRQFELRPELEVAFLPEARFVPYGSLGASLLRRITDPKNGSESKSFGGGPAISLGAHGFITPKVSLDIGLTFRALFVKDTDVKNKLEAANFTNVKQRELGLLFTIGGSFWI